MKTIKNKSVYEQDICGFDGKAGLIVFPDSVNEIKNLVKLSKTDIIPRGNGTSFVGGCVPNSSVIVDMSKMNKILEIDPQRKMVHVEAGAIIDDIQLTGKSEIMYAENFLLNPLNMDDPHKLVF